MPVPTLALNVFEVFFGFGGQPATNKLGMCVDLMLCGTIWGLCDRAHCLAPLLPMQAALSALSKLLCGRGVTATQ